MVINYPYCVQVKGGQCCLYHRHGPMLASHLVAFLPFPPLLQQVVDVPNPSTNSGAIDWAGLANGDTRILLHTPIIPSHLAPMPVLSNPLLQVVDVPNPSKTSGAIDWAGLSNGDAWVALITFLYLDFLDATGTLFTMARLINENVPGESL